MNSLKKKIMVAASASALVLAFPSIANHTWGNANGTYHWDGPSLPLQLSVIDSVDASWQGELEETNSQWNVSPVLNLSVTSTDDGTSARSNCSIANGQIRVCNYTYGTTGWSGLASLNIDSDNHILWGTAKVNDSYSMSQANRNKVMCQEVGHLFGLGHTSEDGSSQQTCMDYANDPTNSQWPNAHDYELLAEIYAHIGGDTPPPTGDVLENGVPVTGLSASTGNDIVYTMDVPSGATNISFNMSGGTGDADMYVKFGSTPTDNSYDCRPYRNGNNETCSGSQSGGTYYVRVKAYSSFSGVSLTGSYTDGGGNTCQPGGGVLCNNVAETNLSGARLSLSYFYIDVPAGASNLSFNMSGGSGDADMYVRFGSQPTTSTYDCRPYRNGNNETCNFSSPNSGRYYVMLRGYSSYSGVTLEATYGSAMGSNSAPMSDLVANSLNAGNGIISNTSSAKPGHFSLGRKVMSNGKQELWVTKHPDQTMTVTHVYLAPKEQE